MGDFTGINIQMAYRLAALFDGVANQTIDEQAQASDLECGWATSSWHPRDVEDDVMATVGGDAPALFGFANERRANLEATTCRLELLAEQANWVDPDRDKFLPEWSGHHALSLTAIVEVLGDAAGNIVHHAHQQEEASK